MYVLYDIFLPQKFPIFFFLLSCDIYYYESFSSVAIFNTMNLKKKIKFNRYLYQGSIRLFIIKINTYTILFLADVYCQITYFVYYNKYTSYIRRIGDFFFSMERICLQDECMHNPSSNEKFSLLERLRRLLFFRNIVYLRN